MRVMIYALRRVLCYVLFAFSTLGAFSQIGILTKRTITINSNCQGFLEYKPVGYPSSPTAKYPLMIYLTGLGSTGNGSSADLENLFSFSTYPHDQQRDGSWVDAYTVNGQTYRFVIITPQFVTNMATRNPTPQEINDVVTYAINNYQVDSSRVYVMGQSQGGGLVWDYASYSSAYAKRVAAILPFGGVAFPHQEKANILKHNNVRVWAFHNNGDNLVPPSFTNDFVDFYNNAPTFGFTAKKTIFNAVGHICWPAPQARTYTENGLNIYQWMLQFTQTPTKAFAGEDREIKRPKDTVHLRATGTGPNGTTSSYSWQKIFGPSTGGSLTSGNTQTPIATGLAQGTYIFSVTLTDNVGGTATDYVAVVVNPAATRYEAENFTAKHPGVTNDPTTDERSDPLVAQRRLDAIHTENGPPEVNRWAEFSVNVPAAGSYRMRIRAGSFYGSTRFNIKNSSNAVLSTVNLYPTGWDNHMNYYTNVFLEAGTQTLRFENFPRAGSNHEVWYLNWFELIQNTVAQYPLPVNFALFNANCVNSTVQLQWKTSGELNSKEFTVEKSANGRDWTSITTLPSAGSGTETRTYNYTDAAGNSNALYRIVQTDLDGRQTYSSIVRGNCGKAAAFSVYPNPVEDKAALTIGLDRSVTLNLSIIDSKGAVVKQQQQVVPQGTSQIPVSMNGLAAGTYTLVAKWDDEVKSVQVLKK